MTMTDQERIDLLRQYGVQQEEEEKKRNSFGLPKLEFKEAPSQSAVDDYMLNLLLVAQPNYRIDVPTLPYIPYNRYSFACNKKPHYLFSAPRSFCYPDGTECIDPVHEHRLRAAAVNDKEVLAAIKDQSRHLWFVINLDNPAAGVHTMDLPVASGNQLYQLWMTHIRREGIDLTNQAASKVLGVGCFQASNGFRQYTFTAYRSGSMQDLAALYMPKGQEVLVKELIAAFHAQPLSSLFYVQAPETLSTALKTGAFDKEEAKAAREKLAKEHGGYPVPTACLFTVTGERIDAPAPKKEEAPAPVEDDIPFDTIGTPQVSGEALLGQTIQVLDGEDWVTVEVTEIAISGHLHCKAHETGEAYRLHPEEDSWRHVPRPSKPASDDVVNDALARVPKYSGK